MPEENGQVMSSLFMAYDSVELERKHSSLSFLKSPVCK